MSDAFEFGRRMAAQQLGVEYQPRQQFNPATQPLEASTGNVNFDEWSDVFKTPLKGMAALLDASQKYVTRPVAGAATRVEASKPIQALLQNPVGQAAIRPLNIAAQGPLMALLNQPLTPERAAAVRQNVAEGGSFTDTFNTRFENDAIGRFATEAAYDPLNLVGGLGGAARAAGAGSRTVRNISAAEDVINAIQGAPISLPLKGVRSGARKLAPKLTGPSTKRLYSIGSRNYEQLLDTLDRLNLPYGTSPEGNLTGVAPEVMIRAFDTAAPEDASILLKSADHSLLGRTFDVATRSGNPNADAMAQELASRGLMQKQGDTWIKSGKLNAHQMIDEVSDVMQHGEHERAAWKDVVDIAANRIWKSNRKAYKNIDDVYSTMNFRAMTDLPAETGDELFARLNRNNAKVEEMLDRFEPKENLAELLRDPSVRNPGIWNWYARSGEFLYNMGFDHSRAFTDEQAEWLFNQPQLQEVMSELSVDPAQALERLRTISKIDVISQFIGAGSMNEGPKRNLFTAMNAYKNILDGRMAPLEGFRIPADVQKKQGIQGPSIASAYDFAGQWNKAYAGLISDVGLLRNPVVKKISRGKGTYAGFDGPVHDVQDKMFLFARIIKEETDAYAAYQAAIKNGATPKEAAQMHREIREEIEGYVSDAWDRRGMFELEGRLSDEVIDAGLVTNRKNKKGTPLPNTFKKSLEERATGPAAGWFATKAFVHEELFPYLTGRYPHGVPGTYTGPTVSAEDMAMFNTRYANPAALQADLWGRFRWREKNAVAPALNLLAGDTDEFNRILAEEGQQGIRNRFGELVRQFMDTDDYRAGQQAFSDESQDFLDVADYQGGTFSNPEIVGEVAPRIRSGEGYQTASGDVLPYASDEIVEAMMNGDYTPLLQTMSDGLKQGMFQMGENGPVVSFFPRAGMSTPIHEIMGHTYRHTAGPEAQRSIRRTLGQPQYADDALNAARMDTGAEETFARAAESEVMNTRPTDPSEAVPFGRMRRLMDLEYMRQQGLDVPDDDMLNALNQPGVVDDLQSVDPRVMSKAQNESARPKDLRRIIRSGEYGVISPRTTEAVDDPALAQKMNLLEAELRDMGYTPYRAEGMYGGEAEPSFFVPGLKRDDAMRLGRDYGQESVMMGREGQVFSDGSNVVRNMPEPVQFTDASDNFTRVMAPDGTEIKFTQPLDFADEKTGLTAAQQAGQDAYDATTFSAPRQNATRQEVLDQIALENNFSPEEAVRVSNQIDELLAPVFNRNPQLDVVQLWSHPSVRENIEAAMRATNPEEARRAIEEAAYAMDGIWSQFGVNHPNLAKVEKILPRKLRDTVKQQSGAYGRRASASRISDAELEVWRSANVMDQVNKVQENYDKNLSALSEIVHTIRQKHPAVEEISDLTTYRDLRRIYEYADPNQKKIMDGFFKTFDIPQISKEEALNLTIRQAQRKDLVLAHQKGLAKELGIKWDDTPQGISQLLQKGTRAWREQALLSVRYHFANGMDMAVKSAIFGINPLVPPGSAQRQVQMWGRTLPPGVRVENYGGDLSALPAEFADNSDAAGVLTKVPGLGRVVRGSNSLARGMENTVREAAFAHAARENLNRNMEAFAAAARREAGDAAEVMLDDLGKSLHGVSMSSDQIAQTIVANGGDAQAAARVATIWDRQLDSAFEEGRNLSNLVHFDFGDETLLEEKLHLRAWAPFHFWATRNIPFYLDTLAANPAIMRRWQDYTDYTENEAEGKNLPNRIRGMAPMPGVADKFLDALFGPGKSYFNPMVVLSIADQMKPRSEDHDAPLLGRMLDKAGAVGLSPAPWFAYPLSILGVYGPEDEQFPVLRYSDTVKNATGLAGIDPFGTGGVDVEAPLRAATNRAREIVTGKEVQTISGSAYKDYQISKRLAEMSIELTGYANHPAILEAMRDPDNPLYKEAEKIVQKENLLNGLIASVVPIPNKRVTDTEQLSRDRQGALPEGAMANRNVRDMLVESGDPAGAYLRTPKPKVLEPVKQDQYGNVQGGGSTSSSSTNPMEWGGGVWGPDSPAPFNNHIIFQTYLRRVATRGYIPPEQFVRSPAIQ